MKRILLMVLRNLYWVPYGWCKLCWYAAHRDKYSLEKMYAFLRGIVARANRGGRVTLDIHGLENIPTADGFMLFPNHQGFYDVLALAGACPRPISVVYKREIRNVPFLKQVLKIMNGYGMDRTDIRQSMQVIINVAREVKDGKNFIIFPEGTREKTPNRLMEFKAGSFKCATKARCPIVPVALVDSSIPFDSGTISPATVQVHFMKPIPYDVYRDMKSQEIAQQVQNQIQEKIQASLIQEKQV